jgi:hypothetical protein
LSALVRPALVGDGIEIPGNARAMRDAARMFGWHAAFRERKDLAAAFALGDRGPRPAFVDLEAILAESGPLVAFDVLPGARSVYGFSAGDPARLALVVGNERRGISEDLRRAATHAVGIPMASRRVNCLNVAAAAAVGLFYLSRRGSGRQPVRTDPERVRPEVLFLGPGDHVELGSSLRSAAAFGWRRVFVEDRDRVWFGAGRARTTEGRAAARRAKNRIRVVPTGDERRFSFEEAVVVVPGEGSRPLVRKNLARGARQLVVLGDPARVDLAAEDADRLGRRVETAGLGLPGVSGDEDVRYRLFATIALAEIARQVGMRAPRVRRRPTPPTWDRSLGLLEETAGETFSLAELMDY